jgi:hypothetical protein
MPAPARLDAICRHVVPTGRRSVGVTAAAAAANSTAAGDAAAAALAAHGVAVLPLGPGFAAEVLGLEPRFAEDVQAPDYPGLSAALQQTLWKHKILAIRGSLSTTARAHNPRYCPVTGHPTHPTVTATPPLC